MNNVVIRKSLSDILTCIESIDYHLQGRRDFSFYVKNLTVKRAVERELTIIGEAVNRVLKDDPDFDLKESKKIISFRNRVIHSYDAVDDNLVWKVIVRDIPSLKIEIIKTLKQAQ